jgi:ABC-type enterochelin transport system permease subunit
MMRKPFIFTKKQNASTGIMSSILGLIANATLGLLVYLSFRQKGVVPERYAAAMLLADIFAVIGIVLGIIGIIQKEKYRYFPYLGLVLNIIALEVTALIIQGLPALPWS